MFVFGRASRQRTAWTEKLPRRCN